MLLNENEFVFAWSWWRRSLSSFHCNTEKTPKNPNQCLWNSKHVVVVCWRHVYIRNKHLEHLYRYLPVVEHRQSEGLSLCVCAEVGLEAEGVDGRDEGLDGVERRAWDWCILGHVTSDGRRNRKRNKNHTMNDQMNRKLVHNLHLRAASLIIQGCIINYYLIIISQHPHCRSCILVLIKIKMFSIVNTVSVVLLWRQQIIASRCKMTCLYSFFHMFLFPSLYTSHHKYCTYFYFLQPLSILLLLNGFFPGVAAVIQPNLPLGSIKHSGSYIWKNLYKHCC